MVGTPPDAFASGVFAPLRRSKFNILPLEIFSYLDQILGQSEACPPFMLRCKIDGGHGARAPLPTLRLPSSAFAASHSASISCSDALSGERPCAASVRSM